MFLFNHLSITTTTIIVQRVSYLWPWFVVRASGFVAALILMLLMLSGIGQVTGTAYRYIEPIKAWAVHKALAIMLLISVVIHGSFLLIDHYIKFSAFQILVPFMDTYNNTTSLMGIKIGSIAVTLGILSFYMIVVLVASSLGWIETKKQRWHNIHYISYILVFFVFVHALYAGSDLKYGFFRAFWILLLLIIGIGIISRLWRIKTIKLK